MPSNVGRLPIFYPKHINLYLQCPERYLHEYVERRKPPQEFSPALAKGIAAHHILNDVALEYQKSVDRTDGYDGPAVPCDLLARAAAALPRDAYPSSLAWQLDMRAVVEDVKFGIGYLDGDARVLASEATLQYRYERADGCPPFVLAAKVDLVLLRSDAEERPYLDTVDFKSGASVKRDPIQELAARIVVKQNLARLSRVSPAYIRSTTVYLGARAVRSAVLDDAECGQRWTQIKQVVATIIEGSDWSPHPSPLCEWCPFFRDGCSLATNGGEADELGEWLDGAAD